LDPEAVTTEVPGLVVLTQTCDIVRSCATRPWVEVAPLVEVGDSEFASIESLRRPRFASIPALRPRRLVADLDRTMTIEKALLASWTRTRGWDSDQEERLLREALARKRSRAAFDDDFVSVMSPLSQFIERSHRKNTLSGRAVDALREIRVQPSPSWTDREVEVFFWFIRGGEEVTGLDWASQVETWLALLKPQGRFKRFDGIASTLEDMTARDYVDSDRLDLDRLSRPDEPENA